MDVDYFLTQKTVQKRVLKIGIQVNYKPNNLILFVSRLFTVFHAKFSI